MSNKYVLEDKSTECLSAIHTTTVNQYLNLVASVYEHQGGIAGQRAPLKTKTGIRIRHRMVSDIRDGAILPPMVLGIVINNEEFDAVKLIDNDAQMNSFIDAIDKTRISIIDGMQRTTAMYEASGATDISSNPVRVEVWLSKTVEKLIYRMLVLNTGQVPWDMKRQLETIYKPILHEIKNDVPNIDILLIDDNSRRTGPGQFQSSKLIEFFLAFSSRKANLDLKEKVAEDFARMDATEATANEYFLDSFKKALALLARLDQVFDKYDGIQDEDFRFKNGKDIFKSSPACLGFIAAMSVQIYGLPGVSYEPVDSMNKMDQIAVRINAFIDELDIKDPEGIKNFLDLVTLNEKLSRKSGKVGEYEREFFYKAFTVLLAENSKLQTMEPCWAAM